MQTNESMDNEQRKHQIPLRYILLNMEHIIREGTKTSKQRIVKGLRPLIGTEGKEKQADDKIKMKE